MPLYKNLDELVRDGMEVKYQCRRCRYTERADPADVHAYVANRLRLPLEAGQIVPDFTLERAAALISCPVCGADRPILGAIRPLTSPKNES